MMRLRPLKIPSFAKSAEPRRSFARFFPGVMGIAFLAAAATPLRGEGIESYPLNESISRPGKAATLFEKLAPDETGIDMVVPVIKDHPMRRAYYSSMACGSVAIGDVDLDGRPDVFATSGVGVNKLYRQTGPWRFEEIGESLGLTGGDHWGVHAVFVDIDNDGDLDLYICNFDSPNQLFVNLLIDKGVRGDRLHFEERAAAHGLDIVDGSVVAAFADYDRDGHLDCYLLTHQIYRAEGRPVEVIRLVEEDGRIEVEEKWRRWYRVEDGKKGEEGEYLYTEAPRADYLFRNRGDGTFEEVTAAAGITPEPHWGNSATWWDYNNDGWPDLYVGNDFKSPDLFYRNNGDGTFTEVSQGLFRHTAWNSMGAAQADFNNRGLFDFIVADMLPRNHYMQKASFGSMAQRRRELENVSGVNQIMRNSFHIHNGTDRFVEGGWMADLAHTDWTWAIRAADFDSDGWVDLFFANGVPGQFNHSDLPPLHHHDLVGKHHFDHFLKTPQRREKNLAFRNRGDFQFEEISAAWGLDHFGMSYGASMADLDGDGAIDLLVSNLDDPLGVYRNAGATGNRIVVELRGTRSNHYGIGALVEVETPDGVTRSRQFFPSGGYLDSDEPLVAIGLGENDRINRLRVTWPGGAVQEFIDLAVNHRHHLTEPDEDAVKSKPLTTMAPEKTRFVSSAALEGHPHLDEEYDDFARQPLMTFKLSQLGPGQAWGDLDGDGRVDLFIGGGAGQPGRVFLNRTPAGADEVQFELVESPAFVADADAEDMGAVFLDADGDGDLDLYVASGSIECDPGDGILRDRLYFNDGTGRFVPAPDGTLPDIRESSGVVAAADLDRDGQLEVFVGTRSIPGSYPASPKSVLLRREGDRYLEATDALAPGLGDCGLVTGAVWTDVNNDGWIDLLVTTDWGPVRLFRNREGRLEEKTESAGLIGEGLEMSGWWTGIDARDINGDGHVDFVASNLGRNTQYQPSLLFPELLFYEDFDNSGTANIVEARFVQEGAEKRLYPRALFHDASFAMPSVADRLQNYHTYASAPLTDIYPFEELESALRLQANCMDSSLFLNDGTGRFTRIALPRLAQISPGFGIVLRDVDLDGRPDCYLVHNHFNPMEELGEMASGLGQLLLNTGEAETPFRAEGSAESGLEVPGDAKSLGAGDLDGDGRVDFVVGVNREVPSVFLNRSTPPAGREPLSIRLTGKKGNLLAVGARVEVRAEGLPLQVAEITGGGSYLTQADSVLTFSRAAGKSAAVTIRWPDGTIQSAEADPAQPALIFEQK
jgi:hypothetical protein